MKPIIFLLILGLMTAGCSDGLFGAEGSPGFGSGTDDYTPSKCACKELPQRLKQQYAS